MNEHQGMLYEDVRLLEALRQEMVIYFAVSRRKGNMV